MKNIRHVGQRLPRKEDRRLTRGSSTFIADLKLPTCLSVAFARSAVAHARIVSIDASLARVVPGVVLVLTGADLDELKPIAGLQNPPPASWVAAVKHNIDIPDQALLATDRVRYVGEPFAIVIAENRYIAEDAAELITIELDELPIITGHEDALAEGAVEIHEGRARNTVASFRIKKGDEKAVDSPNLRHIERSFTNHRILASPMECRGVAAQYDDRTDSLTIWSSTQVVHWVRREVAKQLGLPEARVRCLAPDVGGSFGVKGHVHAEEILVAYLARRLRRPVEWIEDRHEHYLNSCHSRDDFHVVKVAFDESGRIHALQDSFVKDSGAYVPVGIGAIMNTCTHISSLYDIANLDLSAKIIVSNKAPNAPYRGSGRPEGAFVIERIMDLIAAELGIDAVDVRRRNMIRQDQMPFAVGIPFRDGSMVEYDSGDFPQVFEAAIDALGGLPAIRLQQKEAKAAGRHLGLGIGCYVEASGAGPFEGATVRIDPSGTIVVATGACSQGQSHETVFAQVAADEWGVDPEDVTIILQDTAAIAYGFGTIASRSAVNSSGAIRMASRKLREKVLAIAAHKLGCKPSDLVLENRVALVATDPARSIAFTEIAKIAIPGYENRRPPGMTGGLEVTEYFEPPTATWAYGVHAALVEVEPDTAEVRIRRYVVAHDAGVIINPMAADGQIVGGICQGIGGVLLERVVYEDGQILTTSMLDYVIPSAAQMPSVDIIHIEIPTPLNELGVKGLGEGGAVGPPCAIVNGVCDAFRELRLEINESFVSQSKLIESLPRKR